MKGNKGQDGREIGPNEKGVNKKIKSPRSTQGKKSRDRGQRREQNTRLRGGIK